MTAPRIGSDLERAFETLWRTFRGPDLIEELRFAPPRRWRFDFAHEETRVAIELEGGVWTRGRHTRGEGFIRDCEKYNEAARLGWTVFRIPGRGELEDDPEKWIAPILETIERRTEG